MIRRFGGHLGATVSALVDGQLGPEETERAWEHVLGCGECRGQVEREAWIKRRVSAIGGGEPSARLMGSLQGLSADASPTMAGLEAWAEVDRLEDSHRSRRRTAVVVGAGSVGAAVLGFAALGSLGFGGLNPAGSPATSISRGTPTATPTSVVLPGVARMQGRLPAWRIQGDGTPVPVAERR